MACIENLSLEGCARIEDDDFRVLKDLPLVELDAATNEVLAQLKETPLRSLNLMNCPVSDRGLKHLAAMPLETLFLINTAITNDGLQSLRHLPLRELGGELCSEITEQGFEGIEVETLHWG